MGKGKRQSERFIRRLETEFSVGENSHRGISSDFSEGGLFIRTNHSYSPGTEIIITVYLPDQKIARLKGIVRRAVKTGSVLVKNGMGLQLTQKDENYDNFIGVHTGEEAAVIVVCPDCGAKNKVLKSKLSLGPKCGNCKRTLPPS